MISHQLTLEYTLHPGWLAPFVGGIASGTAMARHCKSCASTSFPPLRVCLCGETAGEWVELSGMAHILFRTTGQDGDFGLVQFDGATTKTTLRLIDIADEDTRGVIAAPKNNLPMLCLTGLPSGRAK
ncbi:hypothetical protein [uncultured Roseobacter sp.]|uniref:hypothetical protein n=1 Tax=uncultured Roseobacter sp. TaxID=114847 RepID=UPI00260CFC0C|nr:hypothetical protein [uncultured Roseobacter sp.]